MAAGSGCNFDSAVVKLWRVKSLWLELTWDSWGRKYKIEVSGSKNNPGPKLKAQRQSGVSHNTIGLQSHLAQVGSERSIRPQQHNTSLAGLSTVGENIKPDLPDHQPASDCLEKRPSICGSLDSTPLELSDFGGMQDACMEMWPVRDQPAIQPVADMEEKRGLSQELAEYATTIGSVQEMREEKAWADVLTEGVVWIDGEQALDAIVDPGRIRWGATGHGEFTYAKLKILQLLEI
ncbi:hypothetical protein M9H77_26518 [Catharanthus roseus]|uniref:Uncharacterized protein n=1 Tax=Catharanthus roseus TaxID=4058 RepID=A0ACC0ABR8_CATRO|nr:hypothetical protein M9H77_26518 [Catharanthus roseus]